MAKRLVLFNHTSGISNTASIHNLGWVLSENYRVLLVDADPRCDLTRLILRERFDDYYQAERTRSHNLKDGVSSVYNWRPVPIGAIECPCAPQAPNIRLLPGHANLSEYDFLLGYAQDARDTYTTLGSIPGAFNELITLTEEKYGIDFTLINLAAGLNATNQNLFLHSDVFVVPTCPDPFSVMALDTLKAVLPRWVRWKTGSLERLSESSYPLRPGTPKFGGTLIQRVDSHDRSTTFPPQPNTEQIKALVANDLIPSLAKFGMTFPPDIYAASLGIDGYCLGEIPNLLDKLSGEPGNDAQPTGRSHRDPDHAQCLSPVSAKSCEPLRSRLESIANELVTLLENA